MTDQSLELFKCEPLSAKLSRKACAGNYKIAQHKGQPTRGATHPQGRARCLGCEVGAAHARGELIPVERITWTKPATAATPATRPTEPPPGVVETPSTPPKTPSPRSTPLGPRMDDARRADVLADVLKREMSIGEYATKHGVNQATIRWRLEKAGHDPKTWPKHPAASTPKRTKVAVELNEAVERALAPASPPTPPETTPETAPAPVPEAPTMLSSSTFADVFRACVQEPAHSDEVFRLPHELLDLVAGLDAPASIARVIDCAYMAGMTKGTTESRAWLERATRYARRSA